MKISEIVTLFEKGGFDNQLKKIYGESELASQQERYKNLLMKHRQQFGECEALLFSTPGRSELGGNHTDHNGGVILAAGVNLDTIAVVTPVREKRVKIYSEGYSPAEVDVGDLAVKEDAKGEAGELIRGVYAWFLKKGVKIDGGFTASTTSSIPKGAGLSSSAAFEVLIGTIVNSLYGNGKFSLVELAKAGQFAENNFFHKPCGLMDQMACAYGGILKVDFKKSEPLEEKLSFSFKEAGYQLVVVETGGDHANLTEEYASIPREMRAAAAIFGKKSLGLLDESLFIANFSKVTSEVSDRAGLRGIHFFQECKRVESMTDTLKAGDLDEFFSLVRRSGNSSAQFLQNCFVPSERSQSIMTALALTDFFLGKRGAYRVHGGGFAGTIQAYIPHKLLDEYIHFIDSPKGSRPVHPLQIRDIPSCQLTTSDSNV